MVGFMSMLTPTSMYWNWVWTAPMPPSAELPTPLEKEPVAIGIFEPILSVACCPSLARRRGFCSTLVSLSLSSRLACAWPMVTAKSFAFRWAILFRVKLFVVVLPVGVVVVVEVEEAVVVGVEIVTDAVCGNCIPIFRMMFLLT